MFRFIRNGVVILLLFSAPQALSQGKMLDDGVDICHFGAGNLSEGRIRYETLVISKALELSEERYGTCPLMVHRGEHGNSNPVFHMQTIERYPPNELRFREHHWLTNRYISGVLAYRRLVTKKHNLSVFEEVASLDQLKQLRVGMVDDWVGTKYFKRNHFKVVGAVNRDTIWAMMGSGRFDYTPFGVNEIEGLVTEQGRAFAIVPKVILYYRLPIYLIIRPENGALAERLRYGFKKLHKTGVGEKMLSAEFKRYGLDELDTATRYFIVDGSPIPDVFKSL